MPEATCRDNGGMSLLSKLFQSPPPRPTVRAETAPPAPDFVRYPPFDQGLPVVSNVDMLASQSELIHKLEISIGLSGGEFDRLVLTPIRRLADYVQLLPLTRDQHHPGAGGAFRFALEVAFYALQASEGAIFTGLESTEKRRQLEPRWRYATFLAGLCSELYVPLNDMLVVDMSGAHQWAPYEKSLYAWCQENQLDRYFIRWLPAARSTSDAEMRAKMALSAFVMNHVVPNDCVQYISSGSSRILASMMASVTGAARSADQNTLHQLVQQARTEMINRDLKARPDLYGRPQLGTQVEPHLISAMRQLVKSGAWQVNSIKNCRVWYGESGVFILWPLGGREIVRTLNNDHVTAVPQDEDMLASLLVDANIAVAPPSAQGPRQLYWRIEFQEKTLTVLKLAQPDILFPDELPQVSTAFTLLAAASASPVASPAPPAPGAMPQTAAPATVADTAQADPMVPVPAAGSAPDTSAQGAVIEALMEASSPATTPSLGALETVNLERPVKMVLQAVAEQARDGTGDKEMVWVEHGLAIPTDLLRTHGFELDYLVSVLSQADWLYVDPERPGRLKHRLDLGTGPTWCILLQERYGKLIKEKPDDE